MPQRRSRTFAAASPRRAGRQGNRSVAGRAAGPAAGLVRYWGDSYDWRKAEAKLNALPQFITSIDGVDIHFIHVRSRHKNALPLIVTHGWPGSVIEQLKIIGPLTDPSAHGGRAEDAFDVVIRPCRATAFRKADRHRLGPDRIGQAWAELMKRLGYTRYVAQGGDWGSPLPTRWHGRASRTGRHSRQPARGSTARSGRGHPRRWACAGRTLPEGTRGVRHARCLRQDGELGLRRDDDGAAADIGYGVTDSPAGLAAWLLGHPGFAKWTYGADPEQSPTKDDVLDNITLYWLTNTAASAARIYWENAGRGVTSAAAQKTAEISLPVAITVFPDEVYRPPETWARRAYPTDLLQRGQ